MHTIAANFRVEVTEEKEAEAATPRRPVSRRAPRRTTETAPRIQIRSRAARAPQSRPAREPRRAARASAPPAPTASASILHYPNLSGYDSREDEDYSAGEGRDEDSEDDSEGFESDEDEKEMYEDARQYGSVPPAASASMRANDRPHQPHIPVVYPSPDNANNIAAWVAHRHNAWMNGQPAEQQQHHHHHQHHQHAHAHVHGAQRVDAARTDQITRHHIVERMATPKRASPPKAKKGKARAAKGKRRRSSAAATAKEVELAALLSQLEGPPSVPPMSCAEAERLFQHATRTVVPASSLSLAPFSSVSPAELGEEVLDFSEAALSPFTSLFSDVRSLGASFLRPATSSTSSSSSSSSSSPMSPTSASVSPSTMVDLAALQLLHATRLLDSVTAPIAIENAQTPLLAFIDEWLAGQLPEPPTLVIDDDEETQRVGKKRKGVARTMSMVSWLQLMDAGIDLTTGGDVVLRGGDATSSSTAARSSVEGGMIDLTDDVEAGQDRKEQTEAESSATRVEEESEVKSQVEVKEGKDEMALDDDDEDRPIKLERGSSRASGRSRAAQFILNYHDGLSASSSASSTSTLPASSSLASDSLSYSSTQPPSPPSLPLPILTLVRNSLVTLLEVNKFSAQPARAHFLQHLRFLPNSTQLQQLLTLHFASMSSDDFQGQVAKLQNFLSYQVTELREVNEATVGALHLLSTLFAAYQLARTRSRMLAPDASLFINADVCDSVNLYDDNHYYFNHRLGADSPFASMHDFAFTRWCRFLFSTERKSEIIRHWLDCHWISEMILQAALPTQALTIHLSRQRLVPDLLNAIARTRMERGTVELRKPLHVVFSGEEGIDAGGLKKESLSLATDSMFSPQYGMFMLSDETRTFWFNAHCQAHDSVDEMKGEYQLLGTVIGMALLNNVLLPNVLFPPVVYAKLLQLPLSFADLQTSFPQLHNSLSAILKYDGAEAVEDVFGLTFSVDTEVMGATLTHPLLPNGESVPVTAANRHEYVRLFAKWQLEDSVAMQFDAFARGFWSVLPRHLLAPLLQPVDLELLVCGQRVMDFRALEAATKYEGFPVRGRANQQAAYQAQLNPFMPAPVTAVKPAHPVIRHFWSIVHGLTPAQQKQLLHFVTGSASVPVKGLSEVKLVIANGGRDVRLLPSSRTCFSTLMLPLYKSEAELKKKLLISIEHNTGFGMK